METFNDLLIVFLENYNKEKKKEGFIPTVELLIEDLKEKRF